MEIIFTDLIAESYLLYTKKNYNDIAHFYYKEQVKVKEGNNKDFFSKKEFYTKLITNIEFLIKNSFYKGSTIDYSDYSQDQLEYYMTRPLTNDDLNFSELDRNYNWEECNDANFLRYAILNKSVTLKDPVAFIDPSDLISEETLVLRKSKLEHLKSEAERASIVTSIDELDEIPAIETTPPKSQNSQLNNSSAIKIAVQNAFKFTLKINKTKEKHILSKEDYSRLVEWVTYFFENDYKVPYVDSPITELNIGITYIRYAFKELIDSLHPRKTRPKTFYELVSKCFSALSDDTEELIQQTSKPGGYDRLIKQNSY